MIIITEDEFKKKYSENWMVTDYNGKYTKLPKEKIIITECKDHKGNLSNTPFVAIDNIDYCCWLETFKTLEEAKAYLEKD